jgi:hypothetical protein
MRGIGKTSISIWCFVASWNQFNFLPIVFHSFANTKFKPSRSKWGECLPWNTFTSSSLIFGQAVFEISEHYSGIKVFTRIIWLMPSLCQIVKRTYAFRYHFTKIEFKQFTDIIIWLLARIGISHSTAWLIEFESIWVGIHLSIIFRIILFGFVAVGYKLFLVELVKIRTLRIAPMIPLKISAR